MNFGTTSAGQKIEKVTLHAGDLRVSILTWGAVVQDVRLAGVDHALNLGSDDIADYEGDMGYYGAIVGPIANRISTGRVKIDGMMYELERNDGGTAHLHSGTKGVHLRVWTIADQSETHVVLTLTLPDGACDLPGNRTVSVTYSVTAPATLKMEITGTTDTRTMMNFAHHGYWQLDNAPTWDGQHLQIAADHYLPITDAIVPTGEIASVEGSSMDLRTGRAQSIASDAYDSNFCLSDTRVPLRDVLTLTGTSGLQMTMATTEPGMQVYDHRHDAGPKARPYAAWALEAQFWPDAPNNPAFPSIMLNPDETYQQTTTWSFKR